MAATTNGKKASSTGDSPPRKALGLAAMDSSGVLSHFPISRRKNGEDEVTIKILFCGICHSDLHTIKNEWGATFYPVVPGHEIVGIITEVGSNITKFKVGDKVGVGCIINSCRACESCQQDLENYCPQLIYTYNSLDSDGTMTYGGYSDMIVVKEHFVIRFPENLPLDKGAPLLCAGITIYSPLKLHGLNKPGQHIGIVGLGGLGHIAVKFAKAFGMKVTVISTSPSKEKEALENLGADHFIVSTNPQQMKAALGSLDGIIDTVSAVHAIHPLLFMLKTHGKMILIGVPDKPLQLPVYALSIGGKTLAGSMFGGIKDTQEMIDFAAKHNITADIELISADYVNEAMNRLAKADVRYRFVIDIGNTLNAAA